MDQFFSNQGKEYRKPAAVVKTEFSLQDLIPPVPGAQRRNSPRFWSKNVLSVNLTRFGQADGPRLVRLSQLLQRLLCLLNFTLNS